MVLADGYELDGMLTTPLEVGGKTPAIALCHPHPFFGGNMDNAVLAQISLGLVRLGFATLRFNFRPPEGEESEAQEARAAQDVFAVVRMLRGWPGIWNDRVGVAGYSFGAAAAITALPDIKKAWAFAFVSPTLPALDRGLPALRADKRPKLFVTGERDALSRPAKVKERVEPLAGVTFETIGGADHTWRGHESEVGALVADFFSQTLDRG